MKIKLLLDFAASTRVFDVTEPFVQAGLPQYCFALCLFCKYPYFLFSPYLCICKSTAGGKPPQGFRTFLNQDLVLSYDGRFLKILLSGFKNITNPLNFLETSRKVYCVFFFFFWSTTGLMHYSANLTCVNKWYEFRKLL